VAGATVALYDGRVASEHRAMEGEIVVAGDCVTPGYLSRPELTAAAMVELTTESGRHRYYRTGDFARRDGAGLLHLLGRRDGMVKTRGYRVELAEVECAVGTHPGVAEVAVVAVPDPELTHRLHAFVVARDGVDPVALPGEVVRHCRASHPGYLVPGAVHVCADLPRTSTGKVARAALYELVGVAAC
jgi:acyl-coenzyme A synthetase/AMP-(fatty) acid ligase